MPRAAINAAPTSHSRWPPPAVLSGTCSPQPPPPPTEFSDSAACFTSSRLLVTLRTNGLQPPGGGGIFALFGIGSIDGTVLTRFGMSYPMPADLIQPWRLVMAVFLHGSLMHIVFNMWVLMDIGPQIEELYGSARFFFIYVATGIGGYLLSSTLSGHPSMGGSGALLGLIGVLLAITTGRKSAGMQMLRSQIIRWLIYIAIWGLSVSRH